MAVSQVGIGSAIGNGSLLLLRSSNKEISGGHPYLIGKHHGSQTAIYVNLSISLTPKALSASGCEDFPRRCAHL